MVFLFGALCYTICTMKAPPGPVEGPGASGLLFFVGVPVRCSVLYNMHHEGFSRASGRAWGFMAFIFL